MKEAGLKEADAIWFHSYKTPWKVYSDRKEMCLFEEGGTERSGGAERRMREERITKGHETVGDDPYVYSLECSVFFHRCIHVSKRTLKILTCAL